MPYVRPLLAAVRQSAMSDEAGQRTYARHWAARILCLIILPFSVYMACFKLHFLILNHSGPGDAQMSSLFQAHLQGNDFGQNPLEPVYGSKITLKNIGYGGGLLHSHVQTYPAGSGQQQVTCYHYKDANNEWLVTPTWDEGALDPDAPLRYLKNGDTMRLVHSSTGRNLHSHAVVAPVTKLNNEVSCYGNATIGDANDHWTLEVVDDMVRGKPKHFTRIHSLTTRMRVRHTASGCYLRAANSVLPQWGFKQVEVSCDKNDNPRDEHTYWNIESHWNEKRPSPLLRVCGSKTGLTAADSAARQRQAVQVAFLARFLAPQRRHDDVQQRPRPRPRQGGHHRVCPDGLAAPAPRCAFQHCAVACSIPKRHRDADERLGRAQPEVLPRASRALDAELCVERDNRSATPSSGGPVSRPSSTSSSPRCGTSCASSARSPPTLHRVRLRYSPLLTRMVTNNVQASGRDSCTSARLRWAGGSSTTVRCPPVSLRRAQAHAPTVPFLIMVRPRMRPGYRVLTGDAGPRDLCASLCSADQPLLADSATHSCITTCVRCMLVDGDGA